MRSCTNCFRLFSAFTTIHWMNQPFTASMLTKILSSAYSRHTVGGGGRLLHHFTEAGQHWDALLMRCRINNDDIPVSVDHADDAQDEDRGTRTAPEERGSRVCIRRFVSRSSPARRSGTESRYLHTTTVHRSEPGIDSNLYTSQSAEEAGIQLQSARTTEWCAV